MAPSLVQIFGVSDAHAQELIVGLLNGAPDLEVTSSSSRLGFLVTTACASEAQARWVRRLVTSIDFDARVVYATDGPLGPLAA